MHTGKTIRGGLIILSLVVLGSLPFGLAATDKVMDHMEHMITEAKTPADHEALAAFYDKEAQETRRKQADHLKMKEFYEKNPALNKSGFSFHCQQIALKFDEMAKEYEALAKMHRDMAKTAK
jgi:hypothetical protein